MFYLLIGISAAAILVLTIGGYKFVQNAKIPGYVKLIEKVKKEISSNKEIGEKPVSLSADDEIVEKFSSVWSILDLDLKTILDTGADKKNFADSDKGGN